MAVIFLAGGCLWGVQEFLRHLPGVTATEAGRVNGSARTTCAPYDGYAECVKTTFDDSRLSVTTLIGYFLEIIDPYSLNQQGPDVGKKYRTGVYSEDPAHLAQARRFLAEQPGSDRIVVEVLPLLNYVRSDDEHQDRLSRFPDDYCHIPKELLYKYRVTQCREEG